MTCTRCNAEIDPNELWHRYHYDIFCETCWGKILALSPPEEKIYREYYDPEDGTVSYY